MTTSSHLILNFNKATLKMLIITSLNCLNSTKSYKTYRNVILALKKGAPKRRLIGPDRLGLIMRLCRIGLTDGELRNGEGELDWTRTLKGSNLNKLCNIYHEQCEKNIL